MPELYHYYIPPHPPTKRAVYMSVIVELIISWPVNLYSKLGVPGKQ